MNPHSLIQRFYRPHASSPARPGDRVAIVDPYSTGRLLAGAFAARGVEAVAVLTGAPAPGPSGTVSGEEYAAVIDHGQDAAHTARLLERWNVRHVLAGTESGVPAADLIAHHLGLPGNNPANSATRRNKFDMSLALATAGLAQAKTGVAFNVGGARNHAYEYGWPVVVKPVDSGGSDGVVIARDARQVTAAAAQILTCANLFGKQNEAVLVQEYLSGEQYAVNTVSRGGLHRLVEVWHDRRTDLGNGKLIYDRMDLLEPGTWLTRVLFEYVEACLDALGVDWGPAHSEVVLTKAGPVLIETGARLQGGDSAELMRRAVGTSQTDAVVQATLDSAAAHAARARQQYAYSPVTQIFLQAPAGGRVSAAGIEKLAQIPEVAGFVRPLMLDGAVSQTVDLLSSPGTLYLTGESTRRIDCAHSAVRALEAADLYQPAHPAH